MRRLISFFSILLCAVGMTAQQRFVYLTTDEVRIDSMLPSVGHRMSLPDNFRDSVYTVSLLYPEFIDMSPSDIEQYNHLSGAALPEIPQPNYSVVFDRKKPSLSIDVMPLAFHEGRYQWLTSFMLKVESVPVAKRAKSPENPDDEGADDDSDEADNPDDSGDESPTTTGAYAAHSVLASGKWAKIRVPATGVYELTQDVIRKAGFSNLGKVKVYGYGGALQPARLAADYLLLTDDLKEVPQFVHNGAHLFYAQGPVSWASTTETQRTRNQYSDYGYYLITETDGEPLTYENEEAFRNSYKEKDSEFYHSLYEKDNFAWYHGGRNLYDAAILNIGSAYSYSLKGSYDGDAGSLFVSLTGSESSTVQIAINDSLLGNLKVKTKEYDKAGVASSTYIIKGVKADNKVTIKPTKGAIVRLDYIALTCEHPRGDYDLAGNIPAAEYVHNITNQDHHADPQADMVIIIPTSQNFLTQAKRLADYHAEKDGLRVNIVPADELFNEFSSGTPDANAYRRYLKMLYDRAESEADMPKYLLLFGDCVWDCRLLAPTNQKLNANDLLLCYESENSTSQVDCYVTDLWFGCLDEGEGANLVTKDLPDVAIGRFPVNDVMEAKAMVDKSIAYMENQNAGAWQNTIMFMGDDGNQNLHMRDICEIADSVQKLYPEYIVKKVLWDSYARVSSATGNKYPEATAVIKQQQQAGALIMNYSGHGSSTQISHEQVLFRSDFASFTNKNLPIWITASCDIMPYDNAEPTVGENAVLNSKGGAVAFFGTTRTVYAAYNKKINEAFTLNILDKEARHTIGEAHRLANNHLITNGGDRTENKLKYTLLGDPALRLNLPQKRIAIDAINGQPVSDEQAPQLKAGSKVEITGHIEGCDDFNGIVSATVRDSEETITCRQNDKNETKTALTYKDRTRIIYTGSNEVKDGAFALSFVVPMDINYSNENGLLNVFAASSDHSVTAHGHSDQFLVGGTAEGGNNEIGPSIYCYLNSPSFVDGGTVNTTPYFVAQLTDEDGINVTGSSIGHDLTLIIDGEMSKTYNLNDNFQYDFGSCTSGSTFYSLPVLAPGPHTLKFRAWDIFNNSSTAELSFNVSAALEPQIASISCTDNPASTETTFIVNHDRMGSSIDVIIDVMDMSGRLLWRSIDNGAVGDGTYTLKWNLTQTNGQPLQTGVYLYRVRLACDGSNYDSKAKKLIIVK